MGSFISESSNYLFVGIMLIYVISNLGVFFFDNPEAHKHLYLLQVLLGILFHAVGYITLFMRTEDVRYFFFFAFQEVILLTVVMLYLTIYPQVSRQLLNNMLMLIYVGLVILGRLSLIDAFRQFIIALIMLLISLVVPWIYRKFTFWKNIGYAYAGLGIFLLGAVWLTGAVTNGSKLAFKIGQWSFQPSEFVKISICFFIGAILCNRKDPFRYLSTSLFSLIHIALLVLSKDLGSAGIYAVAFVCMLYVSNNNLLTVAGGAVTGAGAFALAYKAFSHVRIRVKTWLEPWEDMEKSSYQLTQALFAIGTGSWFGMGLCKGSPSSIPYVKEDFIFSAIGEEMGVIFGILLVLLYLLTVFQILRMSIQVKDRFHKIVLAGFASVLGTQVILTIGGGTRFIPLTGVTLPLISMGGSSLTSTILMFSIIQGIYVTEFTSEEEKKSEIDVPDYEEVSDKTVDLSNVYGNVKIAKETNEGTENDYNTEFWEEIEEFSDSNEDSKEGES